MTVLYKDVGPILFSETKLNINYPEKYFSP